MTAKDYSWVVLHDPANTAITLREQALGRITGQCSVCHDGHYMPWELDDSGRCEECRP